MQNRQSIENRTDPISTGHRQTDTHLDFLLVLLVEGLVRRVSVALSVSPEIKAFAILLLQEQGKCSVRSHP